MKRADYVALQLLRGPSDTRERIRRRGGPFGERQAAIAWSHLHLVPTGSARVYTVARHAVRVLVKAVWLFPILLVPKLVLRVTGVWQGDLITVGFVVLVVVAFGSLSLLTLLHLLAGSKSQREASAKLALALPDGNADLLREVPEALALPPPRRTDAALLEQIAHGEQLSPRLSLIVRGRVDAGVATGTPVLSDRWLETGGNVVRVFAGLDFTIVAEGAPPALVELGACPTPLGPYRADALDGLPPSDAWAELSPMLAREEGLDTPDLATAVSCVVRQGDMVEVVAAEHEAIEDLAQLGSGQSSGAPYRGGEPRRGVRLSCTPAAPLLVRPCN